MGQRHNRRRHRPRLLEATSGVPLSKSTSPTWQYSRYSAPYSKASASSQANLLLTGTAPTQSQRWSILQRTKTASLSTPLTQKISERQRLFGGEDEDGTELCEEMIGVVFSLFGSLDYTDP